MGALAVVTADDAPLAQQQQHTAIRLADEGVPIAAIARSMRASIAIVREVLRDALMRGHLAELPADDWPVGSRARAPTATMHEDYEHVITLLCVRYKLSPQEARLLYALTSARELPKERLLGAVESSSDIKLIDTLACRLRKKLRPHGVDIETIWGRGLFIDPKDRMRIRAEISRELA